MSNRIWQILSAFVACMLVSFACLSLWRYGNGRSSKTMRVLSGSMLPHLLGPHYRTVCKTCKHASKIRADRAPRGVAVNRCYNCGGEVQFETVEGESEQDGLTEFSASVESARLFAGSRLCVTRSRKMPARLDLIGFERTGQAMVKRVWGLPNEELRFQAGDLFVDGQRYQKSVAQYLQLAIPVAKLSDVGPRWSRVASLPDGSVEDAEVGHSLALSSEVVNSVATPSVPIAPGQQLVYRHLVPAEVYPGESPRKAWMRPSELNDDYPSDRSVSYALQTISDFGIQLRFEAELDVPVRIVLHAANGTQTLQLLPSSSTETPTEVIDGEAVHLRIPVKQTVMVLHCDHRLLLQSDVETKAIDLVTPASTNQGNAQDEIAFFPLLGLRAFEIVNLGERSLRLSDVELSRDIHLRESLRSESVGRSDEIRSYQVPSGSLFVLGDHMLDSSDSREYGPIELDCVVGTAELETDTLEMFPD